MRGILDVVFACKLDNVQAADIQPSIIGAN